MSHFASSHFSSSHFSFRSFVLALALSLPAFSAAALAQDGTQPPAPIVHQYAQQYAPGQYAASQRRAKPAIVVTSPAPGIWVRSSAGSEVKTVATTADSVELSISKGVANVTIRQPNENEQILVDLPGGQVALVKDGMYTFNVATNTFRVLVGEAAAFPAADAKAKALTVKENHAVVFGAGNLKSVEFAPLQARADLLPAAPEGQRENGYDHTNSYYGSAYGYYGTAYSYGPYGDGFYGAPYYAWGYPYDAWGWGYPYGYGFGIGFGGFWGGGFRGGGFRGGGFRR